MWRRRARMRQVPAPISSTPPTSPPWRPAPISAPRPRSRSAVRSQACLTIATYEPGWLIQVLAVITDPNVAVILMLLGVYGIIFEFTSPGMIAPGVIGTISLLLAFYAFNLLPIDYAGLALMLMGIAFLIVEAYNPTVVLGAGGVIAFLLGAAMLFKVETPGYRLSWPLISIVAVLLFGLATMIGRYVWKARRSPVRAGTETMRGEAAEVLDWREGVGHV